MKEVEDGKRQRESEHTEASTGTVRLVQSDIPSSSGAMGETTDGTWSVVRGPSIIANKAWIDNLIALQNRDSESASFGEEPA